MGHGIKILRQMPNAKILSDIELWTAIITKRLKCWFFYSFSSLQVLVLFLLKTVIFLTDWKFLCLTNLFFNWQYTVLRWPGPIYMPIGYVFESRFSAGFYDFWHC